MGEGGLYPQPAESSPLECGGLPTHPMIHLDPVREKELIAAAKRRQDQAAVQRQLQPTFEKIAQLHTPRGKPKPAPYDAWSAPKNSIKYRMRGIRSCTRCEGKGFYWFEPPERYLNRDGQEVVLANPVFSWIRCTDC